MELDWDSDLGIFLRRDALALGYDDRRLRSLVKGGALHRIRHGAYVPAETWLSADAIARHRLTARAVLRTAHPSAVLSHATSLLEHDVPVWGVDLSEVHLTRLDGVGGRREAGVVHHCGTATAADATMRHGVPVISPGRAAIELTTHTSVESALVSVNWMLHHELTNKGELRAMVDTLRHWPHTLASDLVVRLADSRHAWPGEARLAYLMWREHLPRPVPQYAVYDENGFLVAVLDFAFPSHGVFIEFDGRIKYLRLRREGETIEDVVLREKRREELVCTLLGWVCIRVTWEDLARPAVTARRIATALHSRRTR